MEKCRREFESRAFVAGGERCVARYTGPGGVQGHLAASPYVLNRFSEAACVARDRFVAPTRPTTEPARKSSQLFFQEN